MKKALLLIVLLGLIAVISYWDTLRSGAKSERQYQAGYNKGAQESHVAVQKADSLAKAADQLRSSYSDSLRTTSEQLVTRTDSMSQVLAAKDQEIAALKERARVTKAVKRSAKSPSTGTLRHSEILDYYKNRLAALPKDLSVYERKVALTEVREETTKKFSITMGELDRIRSNADLSD